jgi:hypothetical protein
VSHPTGEARFALALAGDAASGASPERVLAEALSRIRLPEPYSISPLATGTAAIATAPTLGVLGRLLDAVDAVAEILAGGERAKVALDVTTREERVLRLLTSRFLDDAVRDTPVGGVAALASEDFIDAYRDRPGATELADYRRVLVEARPTEIWAWLRTIPSTIQESSPITSLAVSDDGRLAVTGHRDGTVRRWNPSTGTQVGEPFTGHGSEVRAVAIAASAQQIISGDAGGIIRR